MRTGWEIVIEGTEFDPIEFLRTSQIKPCRIWKRSLEGTTGTKAYYQVVEFTDWHDGPYPLDMVTEALDFLEAHLTDFETLCKMPGIEGRYLNFVDTLEGHGGSFDFQPSWIATLATLGVGVSICVVANDI